MPQNYEKSANLADLDRGGATDSAKLYIEKFSRNYGKSARFSASERNNRANFARNRDRITRGDLENSAQNRKVFANFGFTIIEVALVLAIAGLIFLVVFLALPALQKSQRDTARRQDVAKAVAAIQQYFADGGDGAIATIAPSGYNNYRPLGEYGSPLDQYLKNAGISSNISSENIEFGNMYAHPGVGVLELWPTHKCGAKNTDGSLAMTLASNYDMAVVVRLEAGSVVYGQHDAADVSSAAGAVFYCVDAGR